MAKGGNRKKDERPREGSEEPLKPSRVEGRCAFCPCSGRMELPGPTRVDRERMRAGERIYYVLLCPECGKPVRVEDPWLPRDSGRQAED